MEPRAPAGEHLLSRHRFRPWEAAPWLLAVAAYFAFPDYLALSTTILVYILFAVSLDLILGYAGIVTLGHAAFFGTGAYAASLLAKYGWTEPISGLLGAAVAAAIVGVVSGWILLRTHGLTLLTLTFATTIMLQELSNARADITGGFDGIVGLQFDPVLGLFSFNPLIPVTQYFYALAVLLVLFLLVRAIVYSPFGQGLVGIRENVKRMHAIGAPVHRRLVTAYTISAAVAGVAGGLFAQVEAGVTLHVLSFELSGTILIMLILGGTGRLYGAFVGVAVYLVLQDQLAKTWPEYWEFGVGLVLVLVVLFARRGILGIAEDAAAALRRKVRP